MSKRILVTAALPYANGHIHIGHLVEYIQTDIWVRFQRLLGHDARYICADDTHGTAIMMAARRAGTTEDTLLAEMSAAHQADFAGFGVIFDHYGSTNSASNKAFVYDIWKRLRAGGHVDEKVVEQLYDPQEKAFLADRFVRGACPKCGAPDQYGDSCDKCGATYDAIELKNPVSTLSGAKPELKSATHYLVKLDNFREVISAWVNKPGSLHPDMVNWVRNTFLIDGEPLRSWDVSRPAAYFGFEIPDAPGNYFYVWLDAPFGYIASTKDWCDKNSNVGTWQDWWQGGKAELHHFIGKDIAKFHTLFWPAMVHLGGYNSPTRIHIHGFLTVNGEKMSKSKGTFIKARTYLDSIGDPTYLRYYYASKLNGTVSDLDLNVDEFIAKVNSDLVGKLVNLASRTAKFVEATGLATTEEIARRQPGLTELKLNSAFDINEPFIRAAYESCNFGEAVRLIMEIADIANAFVEESAPWALKKDPAQAEKLRVVCTIALNVFRKLCLFLSPIIPDIAVKGVAILGGTITTWDDWKTDIYAAPIAPFSHLLARLDPVKVQTMIDVSKAEIVVSDAPASAPDKNKTDDGAALAAEPLAGIITFEDFAKIDLRVARILVAEEIPKAKKILKLTVTLGGDDRRTIFAGIKTAYGDSAPLVGRLIVIVANLAPRQMSFGLSEGMAIAAGPGDQDIFLLSPDSGAKPGQRVH